MLLGKIAAAASAAFSPSQMTTGAFGFDDEIGQVEQAGDDPAKPRIASRRRSHHEIGRNVFLPSGSFQRAA